jgi:predicted kinase
MNRYWDASGEDENALRLLPFFASLRAAVRMAIAIECGNLGEAQDYRRLALQLLERPAPVLVAIGGLSGSGKSAVGAAVAAALPGPAGARLLRSDVLRKRALGLGIEDRARLSAYAPEKRAQVYRELTTRARVAFAAGASVVADATFRVSSTRDALRAIGGGALNAFWLHAPLHIRLARLAGRTSDASDADAAIAMAQDEPADLGPAWRRIDGRLSIDDVAGTILKEIAHARDAP